MLLLPTSKYYSNISRGSAVAAEHIVSGAHCLVATCKPETIRTLMLVKKRLRFVREAIQDILGD